MKVEWPNCDEVNCTPTYGAEEDSQAVGSNSSIYYQQVRIRFFLYSYGKALLGRQGVRPMPTTPYKWKTDSYRRIRRTQRVGKADSDKGEYERKLAIHM